MMLNLGSGSQLKDGFLNIDMLDLKADNYLKHDLSEGLPVFAADKKPITICSEHMLEHLTWEEGQRLLKSCYRELAPKGEIHLCLPDFRKMVTAYLNNDWEFFNHPAVMPFAPNHQIMEICNFGMFQRQPDGTAEHKTMYDFDYAQFSLWQAGFKVAYQGKFNPEYFSADRERFSFYITGVKREA